MNISKFLSSFASFSDLELNDILSHFKKETVKKGAIFIEEGEISNKLCFLEKGIGRSFYLKKNGKEVTVWFFDEKKFMTSLDSFFQQKPSLYYIEMLEDSLLYTITKKEMDILFEKYHKMEKFVRLLTIQMLTDVINKINAIQFQTAKERYEYMLSEFPNIVHRVPLRDIASYLGITQETLSRIRRKV